MLTLAVTGVAWFPGEARAATCQASGPSAAYTVTVCFSSPSDGSTATGLTSVSATVSVTGTSPGVRRMTFFLAGNYLLTDYQTPYTFTIPSARFADGDKTLEVEAWMRDTFISQRASIDLTFANNVTTPPVNTNTFTPTAGTPGTPFVVGVGGDGAGGEQSATDVTDLIASWSPNLFLYLGDVYEKGTATEFYNWYGQSDTFFGRFRSITDPTIGNHEYENGEAPGYFDYWDNVPHYYSYNTHGWHLISLDANGVFGQTEPDTAQYNWLVNDLNTNSLPCVIAYWHQPLYNIGTEAPAVNMTDIWSLLAQHSVPLIVNGHDHNYQRWVPLDASGNADPNGMTEIVIGSAGHALGQFQTADSRVAASTVHYGAVRLVLNSEGAEYQFITAQGEQLLDSGSVPCTSDPDTTPPSIPAGLTASSSYKTRIDLAWTASSDNVGVTSYEIYRDGQPLVTIGTQTSYADNSVSPGSTHSYKVRALDAQSNASGFSNTATATTPTLAVLFHDGFESGNLSSWTQNSGLTAQQSEVFAGAYAARAVATGILGASAYKQLAQTETNLFFVARFKVLGQSQNVNLLRFRDSTIGASAMATLFISTTSHIGLRNDVTAASTSSTSVLPGGVWHTAQVHVLVNGTLSQTEVWIDGVQVPELSQSGVDLGTNPIGRVELGDPSLDRTFDVAFDEVAFDREFIDDQAPPTAATNLTATAHSGLEVDLSWSAGTDDVGITGYHVYRNNILIATAGPGTSYADKTVSPHSSYTYKLVSTDAFGNTSGPSNTASVTTAEVFSDDFETGNLTKWSAVTGLTVQQAVVDEGQWSARATSTGTIGASAALLLDAPINELFYRTRFQVITHGANPVSLIRFRSASNNALASVFVASTDKLSYRNDTSSTVTATTQTVTPLSWHKLEMRLLANGGSSQVEIWLDGIEVVNQTDSFSGGAIGKLELGDPSTGRSFDVAFDNVFADTLFSGDNVPPSDPTNLHVVSNGGGQVVLGWTASQDNVGVTNYRVWRNGAVLATIGTAATYTDSTVAAFTHYDYNVQARDHAGNLSGLSNTASVNTPGPTLACWPFPEPAPARVRRCK